MRATFVDLSIELDDIGREASHLFAALDRNRGAVSVQESWERTHMLASAIEKIYTGCERVMARLASDVDGAPVSHAGHWHVTVLKRLAHPFPDVRGAVFSPETYAKLDRLRSFRHRERNSYGIDLDPSIVLDRASEAGATFSLFKHEVTCFMARQERPDGPAVGS